VKSSNKPPICSKCNGPHFDEACPFIEKNLNEEARQNPGKFFCPHAVSGLKCMIKDCKFRHPKQMATKSKQMGKILATIATKYNGDANKYVLAVATQRGITEEDMAAAGEIPKGEIPTRIYSLFGENKRRGK
jgi:hypothetical protein